MRDRDWPDGAYVAEFPDVDALREAATQLRARGYTRVEIYSPIPVPEAEEALGYRTARLPLIVFAGGVFGGVASYVIQWYANVVSYPLNIGGRPVHAVPAFVIPTFEGTVLCGALAAFFGLFAVLRLPTYWHPVFEIPGFERATVDRFWLAVDARDRRSAPELTPAELGELAPLRVLVLETAA